MRKSKKIKIINILIISFIITSMLSIWYITYGATTSSSIGENVEATFNSVTGELIINSTSGVGTIESNTYKNFLGFSNREKVKKVIFSNEVYAPEDMENFFAIFPNVISINLNNLNTSNVTNMKSMFSNCINLTSLDVSKLDTTNVTNMESMFSGCSNLESLNIGDLATFNVTNVKYMFQGCTSLTNLNLEFFDTDNVTDMSFMFQGCTSLTNLNLRGVITSEVNNMNYMFAECNSLTNLDLSGFNTSKVTNMANMFTNCTNLASLDLSGFNTSNVTDMMSMFYECSSLISVDVSNFNTSNVDRMVSMFYGCSGLESLDISSFDMSKSSSNASKNMLSGCNFNTLITPKRGNTAELLPYTMYDEEGSLYTQLPYNSKTLYKKIEYTVQFNENGGTINSGNINKYIYGVGATLPIDVTKTGYIFDGWYEDSLLLGDKVTSISSTATGNKIYYAKWIANTNTSYKVEHYKQTGTGYALEESEDRTGTTGAEVTAEPKTYAGYTENTTIDNRVASGTIAGDGSLVLKLYYDRNTNTAYTVEHYKQTDTGYALEESEDRTGTTGAEVTAEPKTYAGYTENTTIDNRVASGTIAGDGSLVLKLYYDRNTNTAYTVEHYKRTLDNELIGYELFETKSYTGTTDTTATAIAQTYTGFTENTTITDRVASGTIAGDGSLVLKLYYDRNIYKINYELNGGIAKNPLNKNYTYGEEVILSTRVEKEGYIFEGWYENQECTGQAITKIENTETGDKTYYAKWTKQEEIPFTISSEKYEISNQPKYITKVSPETTAKTFMNNITTNGTMKVFNSKGEQIKDTDLVGTGYKLEVEYKGTKYEYEIAVRGDIDGNGKITIADLSTLNQAVIKKITLTGIRQKAADIDENGKITATDLSTLNQAVIKKITL